MNFYSQVTVRKMEMSHRAGKYDYIIRSQKWSVPENVKDFKPSTTGNSQSN
jgi:pyocin large subunit-like protein